MFGCLLTISLTVSMTGTTLRKLPEENMGLSSFLCLRWNSPEVETTFFDPKRSPDVLSIQQDTVRRLFCTYIAMPLH